MNSPPHETLVGHNIVVTGGSMGIGYACAEELARSGARVTICARGKGALEQASSRLRSAMPKAEVAYLAADVSDPKDVNRLLDAVERVGPITGLVHAAAVLGAIGSVVTADPEQWFEVVRINLYGSFLVARGVCQRMIRAKQRGSVVLFSGGGATSPFPNFTAYGSSKAAVVRLAETLAQEVAAHGIRVNCVSPGFVATRMQDQTLEAGEAAGADYIRRTKAELKKGGVSPTLAARAVAFLLSDRGAGITGRLLAAPWDRWDEWPEHLDEMSGSDVFTLRRIVPRDRGMNWQ